MSVKEMSVALDRTEQSVRKKIIRMNLCSNSMLPETFSIRWTEEQETYLRKNYRKQPIEKLAEVIGKSENTVQKKAERMGLRKTKRRHWSKKEEDFLEDHYLTHTAEWMAKKLKRSKMSVTRHIENMNLNRYDAVFSLGYIAKSFNYDKTSVKRLWIDRYHMPVEQIVKGNGVLYDVDPVKFWEWAVQNEKIIPWERYERGMLPDEPENLTEIIRKYI